MWAAKVSDTELPKVRREEERRNKERRTYPASCDVVLCGVVCAAVCCVLCAVCCVLCAVCYVCAVLRTNTGVTLLLPQVHSLSLGAPEDEVGDDIIKRMNTEMAALGVRGVSVVFASGDSGYGKYQKYGAASPYVTSVGGIYNGKWFILHIIMVNMIWYSRM